MVVQGVKFRSKDCQSRGVISTGVTIDNNIAFCMSNINNCFSMHIRQAGNKKVMKRCKLYTSYTNNSDANLSTNFTIFP